MVNTADIRALFVTPDPWLVKHFTSVPRNWGKRSTKRYSLISIPFPRHSLFSPVYGRVGGTETRWCLRLRLTPHTGIRPFGWVQILSLSDR